MITRRLVLGAAAAMLLPAPALFAQQRRQLGNGIIDPMSRSFLWTNGGGDPLRLSPQQALALPRVRSVVPPDAARLLIAYYRDGRGHWNRELAEDDRDDLMISGGGRVEHNVVARVSAWRRSASKRAMVIYYTEPQTGNQWRVTFYEVCRNIGVTRTGAGGPAVCICEEEDVCWS